jgi:hypothetical protein
VLWSTYGLAEKLMGNIAFVLLRHRNPVIAEYGTYKVLFPPDICKYVELSAVGVTIAYPF